MVEDPLYQEFINKRNLNEATIQVYNGRLRSFCEFIGLNPSELIKEAKNKDINKITQLFAGYMEHLKDEGRSTNTIYNKIDTVKAFYQEYDIDIKHINDITPLKEDKIVSNEIITKEQLQEALKYSNLRDKAIILLHMSSGMEATEVRKLTYGNFLDSIREYVDIKPKDYFNISELNEKLQQEKTPIGTWKIKKNRTNKYYITFNNPESINAILDYMMDRERKNKPIRSLKDPLFVNSQNKAMNSSAHGSIFKSVNQRANFGHITEKRRFFSSTMLRRYFKDKLRESGVEESLIKTFSGQKPYTNKVSPKEITKFKKEYLSAIENLSLENPKTISLTTAEYNRLLDKIETKDKELKEIKKHLQHLKYMFD